MIDLNTAIKDGNIKREDVIKSMAKEQIEITDHIKEYLSKADKFSVRMSSALVKSHLFKSKAALG